jgi:predicted O-linked N-acetylglucosamine transferase (SPINDLY family)
VLRKAISLHQKGQIAEAASLYRKILAQDPRNADALHLLGVIELQKKSPLAAIELIDRAIRVSPKTGVFFVNRGAALQDLKRLDEALSSYDHALALMPDHVEALCNRAIVLKDLGRLDEALSSYDRALAIKPAQAEALYSRGNLLRELGRLDEALLSYDRALAIRPDYAQALNNRGSVLGSLKRFDEALVSFDRVLHINPDQANALYNRGKVLQDFRRLDDALASYDRAVAVNPDYADALHSRAVVLQELGHLEEALASYDRALAIKPGQPFLFGDRLHCKMRICDWRGLTDDFRRLGEMIGAGKKASSPFPVIATPLSAALQRACSEIYIREERPPSSLLPELEPHYEHDRIRLGYFSADFRNHAVAYLMAELFEHHDRDKFEVLAFSSGPPISDAMRTRLVKSFDRFIDVGALSDQDAAMLVRKHEVDIAIDLNGFTQGSRTKVFAMRAAPIQVNYLGYPGTMGASYIDYLIADSILVPNADQQHYTEKIVYLPDTFQVNSRRVVSDKQFSKAECGLPATGFIFCCFNNSYKILPETFDVWMSLLKRVDDSALWLLHDNDVAAKQLRAEAQARGIAPARLIFAKRMDLSDHLARHRLADLFLDTLPCNAGTTASDALWAGLPILTCLGGTLVGRVAARLLKAVGLPELVTENRDQYEALALRLAANPQELLLLREKLAANRLTHPLFDVVRFTKNIETAYISMWKRSHSNLAPDNIYVRSELDIGGGFCA